MKTFSFSALGTQWNISIDADEVPERDMQTVYADVSGFESRFSRFRKESEVNAFRDSGFGTFPISETLSQLLGAADVVRQLTRGRYDPAAGELLERAGYDDRYRLRPDEGKVHSFQLPEWTISGRTLSIGGPVVFDLGGIGKGFCIDRVADTLKGLGYEYFLVEAGGDMFGTTKHDGSPYRVALEWPGRPGIAFGTVDIARQGLAASDRFRRRWGLWNHIVDPNVRKPIESIDGCVAAGKSAFLADQGTSALFLSSEDFYEEVAWALDIEYVVFSGDASVFASPKWPGKWFS